MKAKAYQIPALTRSIQHELKGALVYGTDWGVVQETAEKIARLIAPDLSDSLAVCRITAAHLKETPSFLLDEANTPSLMGGRRLIWLANATAECLEPFDTFLDHVKTDTFVLLTAEMLSKSAGLRALCENHPQVLAVACYADEEKDIRLFIQNILSAAGFDCAVGARALLAERLNENRTLTRRELEKLMTYMGAERRIREADVEAVITDTTQASAELLCYAVAGGSRAQADRQGKILLSRGETAVGLIRQLQQHFSALLAGLDFKEQGLSSEAAAKRILRPAQFRLEEAFMRQLSLWSKERVVRVLEALVETERALKSSDSLPELVFQRTLLQIAGNALPKSQAA